MRQNDTFLVGFAIGAVVPVLGYWAVTTLFDFLTSSGMMDEVTISTANQRLSTVTLVGLCFNIIPAQYFASRRYNNIITGIAAATMIYAMGWGYIKFFA